MPQDSSLLPTSRDTDESTSSDSSVQPHCTSDSEMNGSQNAANETHRGMKSRHLTMIGMYPSYSGIVI